MPIAEGVDDVTAAALGNTGLAAWTSLTWRARLQKGESVLVLGACGALGRIAHQGACALGAGVVVAADRPGPALERPGESGLVTVPFGGDPERFAHEMIERDGPFDVIIDPLWGLPALSAIKAARHGARLVQMGQLASPSLNLMATDLRARAVDVLSYALFHYPFDNRRAAYLELTKRAADGEIKVDVEAVAVSNVEDAWDRQAAGVAKELVIVPDGRA